MYKLFCPEIPTGSARWLLGAGLLALVAAGCTKAETAKTATREEVAKAVKTEAVREESVRRGVDVVGTLAAVDQVTISAQVDGAVGRILADLGDKVKAGQPLIELDREKLQYNLDQQRAALARALAKFGATEPGRLPQVEQTPDVQKAAAELAQARQAHERATELQRQQLIPKQTLDDAETTLRSKQASYESALQNAKNLKADIDASDAVVKLADRQLRDAVIRAPFDGYVQKRLVSQGEFVKNQTPVMSVVKLDPLKVTGEIPEGMAPWIAVAQPAELRVDAYPDKTLTGKVSRISPTVNTQTRAFPFEALVPNADGLLKPGTFARVHIATARIEPVLTIPYAGMQYRYGVNRAFVLDDNRLSPRELKLGDRLGDRVEILGGLKAGELIALTDVDNLTDGMKVTVNRRTE